MIDSKEKARLAWHCRRGMLEVDLLLKKVLLEQVDSLTKAQLESFNQLLNCTDPEIFAWLMNYEEPPKELKEIVELIRNHH